MVINNNISNQISFCFEIYDLEYNRSSQRFHLPGSTLIPFSYGFCPFLYLLSPCSTPEFVSMTFHGFVLPSALLFESSPYQSCCFWCFFDGWKMSRSVALSHGVPIAEPEMRNHSPVRLSSSRLSPVGLSVAFGCSVVRPPSFLRAMSAPQQRRIRTAGTVHGGNGGGNIVIAATAPASFATNLLAASRLLQSAR